MKKRWWVTILILAVIFGSIFGFKIVMYFMIKSYMTHFHMPPASVTAETLSPRAWQPTMEASGQLVSVQGVALTSRSAGMIDHYSVTSGSLVKAGDIILSLNHDDLDASLKEAKAKAALAKVDFSRQQALFDAGATSKQSLDEASATFEEAAAQVQVIEANVEDRIVRAPFDGKVGILPGQMGQYVNPGDNLGMISDPSSLWVEFPVTQPELSKIESGRALQFTVDAYPGVVFKDAIQYVDNYFSNQTYALTVRGKIQNKDPKHPLYPGMVITVQMLLDPMKNVLVADQQDIVSTLYGDSVFLVDGKVAKQVYVLLGPSEGSSVVLASGVKSGDEIVTSGQMKLQDGSPITVVTAS